MWKRLAMSGLLALSTLLGLSLPALAGGWALTTFDPLPAEFRAGQTYHLGYTIRQHGVTPFSGAQTRILLQAPATGQTTAFSGHPEGLPGHYAADVWFPDAGVWSWQVDQAPFSPQALGTLSVLPAGAPAGSVASAPGIAGMLNPAAAVAILRLVLSMVTLLAGVIFAWRLVRFRRRAQSLPTSPVSSGAPVPT